jgi:hypothetical protein
MMDAVLLLISGASGAGMSSVRQAIDADLEPAITAFELRHLGAIPNPPTLEWRQRMAEAAVRRAMALGEEGRHLLLAGDAVVSVDGHAGRPLADQCHRRLEMSRGEANKAVLQWITDAIAGRTPVFSRSAEARLR